MLDVHATTPLRRESERESAIKLQPPECPLAHRVPSRTRSTDLALCVEMNLATVALYRIHGSRPRLPAPVLHLHLQASREERGSVTHLLTLRAALPRTCTELHQCIRPAPRLSRHLRWDSRRDASCCWRYWQHASDSHCTVS